MERLRGRAEPRQPALAALRLAGASVVAVAAIIVVGQTGLIPPSKDPGSSAGATSTAAAAASTSTPTAAQVADISLRTFTVARGEDGSPATCDLNAVSDPVEGTLRGDASAREPVWLEAADGRHVSVVWPDGFTVRFEPAAVLYNQKQVPVASAGARVVLSQVAWGGRAGTYAEPYIATGLVFTGCYREADPESAVPEEVRARERRLLPTYDLLSELPGFQVGGLDPNPAANGVVVYWKGEFGAEAQGVVEDANRRGIVVNVIRVPYSFAELRETTSRLVKALEAKGIKTDGYTIGDPFDVITVWGRDLDESAELRRRAEKFAAEVLPNDLKLAIVTSLGPVTLMDPFVPVRP